MHCRREVSSRRRRRGQAGQRPSVRRRRRRSTRWPSSAEAGGCSCPSPVAHTSSRTAGLPSRDRKSTRLNSSHITISYAVFCLKKKKKKNQKLHRKKKKKKKNKKN